MDNIRTDYNLPQSSYMESDKFKNRFHALKTDIQKYIDASGLSDKVRLNNVLLAYANDNKKLVLFTK